METSTTVTSQPLLFMTHDESLQLIPELTRSNIAEAPEAATVDGVAAHGQCM